MNYLKQRQQLELKLELQAPRMVFVEAQRKRAPVDLQPTPALLDSQCALDLEFEKLPMETEHANIILDPIANTLSMRELRLFLHRCSRLLKVGGRGHMTMANPDHLRRIEPSCWPGEQLKFEGQIHRYRPWRQWWELLRLFPLNPQTPIAIPSSEISPKFLWLSFEKTNEQSSLADGHVDCDQKYGTHSSYRYFNRLEEPEILDDWCYAASKLRPVRGETILSLGCNDGREFEMFSPEQQRGVRFVGVDASQSAIESARQKYEHEFHCHDLMKLPELEIGPVHIALLLNVLQCTSLNRDEVLNQLLDQLSPASRLLISVPNCHFGANDILRRPLDRRSKRHDRGLVHKDLRYLARTFYRHGFGRIEAFGTYDAFLLVQR
ncbi:MAG: class I SAM-dependent methyltransferase [bacterium]|nr:class I SAM-dependent methyltransferase [bacterium]